MNAYCEVTRDNTANEFQKTYCCGKFNPNCRITSCTQQDSFTNTCQVAPPSQVNNKYFCTFRATGCPNPDKDMFTDTWWHTQTDQVVLPDMNAYCELTRDNTANEFQKAYCCGKGNPNCKVTSCTQQDSFSNTCQVH